VEQSVENPDLAKLRSEALNLPEAERAELACDLVSSLDRPSDTDVVQAWDTEIRRRLAEIGAGTADLFDRKDFHRRVQAGLVGH
jgi:putative addiction module component (TIGR02574 family)